MSLKKPRQMAARRFSAAAAILVAAFMLAPPAAATPWWVAWEGDDFPENEGWERDILMGGDVRTLADGCLTLDGLSTDGAWDSYWWQSMVPIRPSPGEEFVIRWRMRITTIVPASYHDAGVVVYADDHWWVDCRYKIDRVRVGVGGPYVLFEPGVFHTYELRSADMRTYRFSIDGVLALAGSFLPGLPSYRDQVLWGDDGWPAVSLSTWDYVEFGIVPEPVSGLGSLILAVIAGSRASRLAR